MKILLIEDSQERINQFKEWFPCNIDIAEDAKTAIELLKINTYNLFFFDHDLGGLVFVDSKEENTGYTVAKYIAENKIKGNAIIHSWNPEGAKNIQNILGRGHLMPFGTFICETEVKDNEIVKLNIIPIQGV